MSFLLEEIIETIRDEFLIGAEIRLLD